MEKYVSSEGRNKQDKLKIEGGSIVKLSNKERDSSSESSEDDKTGIGRTYECNFCKRGFTNAQALGGHMNIHRKDKAKAREKQQQPQVGFSSSSCISYKPTAAKEMEPIAAYSSSFAGLMNYEYPFVKHTSEPAGFSSSQSSSTNRYFTHSRGHVATDLSLSIDRYREGHDKDNNKQADYNDIDLELRLGYHP